MRDMYFVTLVSRSFFSAGSEVNSGSHVFEGRVKREPGNVLSPGIFNHNPNLFPRLRKMKQKKAHRV